jgi:hypothetical protein
VKKYITLAMTTPVVVVLVLLTPVRQARAQKAPFIYSVKFVCGLQTVPSSSFKPPAEPPVKPGNYATVINIHNFHRDITLSLFKKAVMSIPEVQLPQPSPTSPFQRETLNPNQAIEVDCTEIVRLLSMIAPPPPLSPFITGFVEIASPNLPLSVTAVYTAQTCLNPGRPHCSSLGQLRTEVVPQPVFPGP